MCNVRWCSGDCEDCKTDKELEKQYEESKSGCSKGKCNWVVVHTKQDKCTTCGETYNY